VGLELFLKEGEEVLVARDGQDVTHHVEALTPKRARAIGTAARSRILAEHTYQRRGAAVDRILREEISQKRQRNVA
jgi:spore maturation protein CgeB